MMQPAPQFASTESLVTTPVPEPARSWVKSHDVQFYDSEEYLFSAVATFLVDGLRVGQPVVVIATEAHRRGFMERMRAAGFDPRDLVEGRDVVWLDARQTLAAFMEGGRPNADLFEATVGSVFQRLMKDGRAYVVSRAYGEMVDLLWKDGNIEGAIALEDLWNGIGNRYAFSLLCAYSMGNFLKEGHTEQFAHICGQHGRALPTEKYTQGSDTDRLRQIALLQQRAAALEAEVRHRKEVETALRDVLAHRRRLEDALRSREADLRDFVENAPVAIHWVGAEGTILYANAVELDMLGYSRSEYVGRNIVDFHQDRVRAEQLLARLKANETIREFQAALVCKDGSVKRVTIDSNVRWENGAFSHTRCFTRELPFSPALNGGSH